MPEDNEGSKFKTALLYAVYEYLMVALPVALYVYLHALQEESVAHGLVYSPEWNIATIFLLMQGQFLYHFDLESTGRRLSRAVMGIIMLLSIVGVILAASNIQLGLRASSRLTATCMWLLFALGSTAFVGLVVGARLVKQTTEGGDE